MLDRFSVVLFPSGANPDRGKYAEDERLARIRLLLDAIEDASSELQRYLGPTAWMHWLADNAVIDCREELGLRAGRRNGLTLKDAYSILSLL